jgi:outer membrane protein OmpA-like peptidoglycan-associated protein
VQVDLKDGQKTLEGARTTVSYELKDNATAETDLALKTNFIQAFKAMGATVVSDPVKSDDVVAMEKTPLGEFWLLYSRGSGNSDGRGSFSLVTVQVTPFAQEVQTQPMKAALDVSAKCGDPAWLVKQFAQYKLASCECRYWDAVQLSLPGGAKKLEGVRSTVTYSLTDDKKTDTALNVQKNYLQALKASGATIVSDPGNADQVVATQKSAAGEFWFIYDHGSGNDESTSSYSLTTVQIVQFPQIVQARPEPSTPAPEAAKCQGPAWLVKQFPYYNATQCNTRDFDSITLDLPSGKKTLAGRVQITDFAPANPNIVATQIYAYKNYVNALTGIGAKQVSDPNNPSTAIFTQSTPQGEFWYIYGQSSGNAEGVSYELTTVQIGGPPPKTCTLEIYGVNFDFNKSTLRPDSEPVLQQVLALFNADPSFGGEIGGHTDNVGTRAYNMKLSASRAEAVKAWLVAHGVAASRMTTAGYADTRPLVPNTTDANRFKNRRVELKRSHCK